MRILHLLDVSAPTIAGYASRSRAIVNGQRAIGLDPIVLTSVRHKNMDGAALEEIDGIRHYRTLKPTTAGRRPLTACRTTARCAQRRRRLTVRPAPVRQRYPGAVWPAGPHGGGLHWNVLRIRRRY